MSTILPGLLFGFACLVSFPRRYRKQHRVHRRPHNFRLPTLRRAKEIDLGVLALEVSTRLRAGMSTDRAWGVTLTRHGLQVEAPVLDDNGRPRVLTDLSRKRGPIETFVDTLRGRPRLTALTKIALPSLLAATVVTSRTGAPVADVLDECAEGLTEAGQAQSARQIALQGPKSTATLLAWLPVLGLFFGTAMGVHPVGFLLGTSFGHVCLILGIASEVTGLLWVRKLVHSAQAEGAVGRSA